MPTAIILVMVDIKPSIELNNSRTATTLALLIPLEPTMMRWGDEPRAASLIQIGRLIDDPQQLKRLDSSIDIRIEQL